jgi:glutaminase
MLEKFEEYDARLDFEEFVDCIQGHTHIIEQAVTQKFVLPEFQNFKDDVKKIFEECRKNTSGANASYIPELAKANPNDWGVSVCTIDGQRLNLGDTDFPFSVQSTSKPISYAIALENHGPDKVHQHVGHEPSGVSFNAITLNPKGLPHNPLINAGAIMVCSLIKQDMAESERFSYVTNFWSRLSGGK